jgi:hypothetical protein
MQHARIELAKEPANPALQRSVKVCACAFAPVGAPVPPCPRAMLNPADTSVPLPLQMWEHSLEIETEKAVKAGKRLNPYSSEELNL